MAAAEPDDSKFKSNLDEESKKKAKQELNELNELDRIIAVQTFRQWVNQQKWLNAPTDFEFLLRFLRVRKFSQLEARKTFENYWACKTQTPEWYRNVDPTDPVVLEILKTGFYVVPKRRDKHGRRVIIEKLARLDMTKVKKEWGVENVFKTITLICDWANRDENVQVNGIIVFIDNTDVTWAHIMTLWSAENGKKIMQFYQNSLPARMKGLHLYNEPAFFDAMFGLFGHLMKQKNKDRMHLHGRNLSKVYDEVGMEVLPDEYLPDDYDGPSVGSCESIVEEMVNDMTSQDFRDYMKKMSSEQYGVDLSLKKQDDTPVASFRKLNVE